MNSQISQHLGVIVDAVKKIEELLGMNMNQAGTPAPTTPAPTPVPGVKQIQVGDPVSPPPVVEVVDSFQMAIADWKAGVTNHSTVVWVKNGMRNWVDTVDPTGSIDALGCSMAFISFLIHQGITLDAIEVVALPGSTPAQVYQALNQGLSDQAWSVFSGVMRALGGRVSSSDPFCMIQSAHRVRPISHV